MQDIRSEPTANAWQQVAPSFVLLAAAWFALVTGLTDAGVLGFRKVVLGELIRRSMHVGWMAPVAYLVFFALPALALYFVVRRWPRLVPPVVAIGLIALASTTSILLLLVYQKLHDAALALLALGLAVQIARVAANRLTAFARMLRRTTPLLALLVVLIGAGTFATQAWAERSVVRGLPAARAGAPNILFIILDTVRAASMGLYGHAKANTPNLERWASRGVIFERAISPSSWTLPSHASMFTGRPPHQLSTHWLTPLDNAQPTLAELLRDNGYRTGGFVANLQYATWEMGLDRGFERYRDYQVSFGQVVMNSTLGRFIATRRSLRTLVGTDEILGRKNAAAVNAEFLDWVAGVEDRPFFAFLNFFDAHDPYLPPDTFYRAMAGRARPDHLSPLRRIPVNARRNGIGAEAHELELDSYDASIAYLDYELDRLFKALRARGVLDNTIVVVTSDHGEEFGEHGLYLHGNSLYMQSLHVPLMIWGPAGTPSMRVATPVSLTDLAATLGELAQINASTLGGTSLAAHWRGTVRTSPAVLSEIQKGIRLPEWYPVSRGDMASIISDDHHYIRGGNPNEQLFDWRADPWEQTDLVPTQPGQALLGPLRTKLDAASTQSGVKRREQ